MNTHTYLGGTMNEQVDSNEFNKMIAHLRREEAINKASNAVVGLAVKQKKLSIDNILSAKGGNDFKKVIDFLSDFNKKNPVLQNFNGLDGAVVKQDVVNNNDWWAGIASSVIILKKYIENTSMSLCDLKTGIVGSYNYPRQDMVLNSVRSMDNPGGFSVPAGNTMTFDNLHFQGDYQEWPFSVQPAYLLGRFQEYISRNNPSDLSRLEYSLNDSFIGWIFLLMQKNISAQLESQFWTSNLSYNSWWMSKFSATALTPQNFGLPQFNKDVQSSGSGYPNANSKYFDGLIFKLRYNVKDQAAGSGKNYDPLGGVGYASVSAFTNANVISYMQQAYNLLFTSSLATGGAMTRMPEKYGFLISPRTLNLLQDAFSYTASTVGFDVSNIAKFDGIRETKLVNGEVIGSPRFYRIPILVTEGFPDNLIITCAVGGGTDSELVATINTPMTESNSFFNVMLPTNGDRNVRFRAVLSTDVGFKVPNQIAMVDGTGIVIPATAQPASRFSNAYNNGFNPFF